MEELCARHSLPGEQAQDTFPRYSQTLPRTFLATDRQKVLRQPLAPLATRPAPATAPLPSPSPVARSSSRPRSASPSRISTRWPTCCGACLARSSSSGRGPARCSHKTARKTCSQTAPAPAAAPRPSQHGDGAASSGADPRLVPLSDARHAARGESRNHPPLRPLPSSSLALRPVVRPLPPPRSNPLPPPPMRAGWRRGPLRLRRRPRRDRVAACAGGPALLPLLRPPGLCTRRLGSRHRGSGQARVVDCSFWLSRVVRVMPRRLAGLGRRLCCCMRESVSSRTGEMEPLVEIEIVPDR